MIEIKDRFTARVIYSSDKATTVKEALLEAIQQRAYLSGANLSGADLSGAYLSRAYLSGANLSGADLSGADLSGADLSRADLSGADLSGADLSGAYLSGANLSGADLSRADLSRADLSGADLSGAYLSRAYLSGANLSGADLSGAIGYNRYLNEPLLSLYDQPGQIVMYKLVTADGTGPTYPGIQYEIGKTIRVAKKLVQTNDEIECGAGVNVATLPWVLQHWTKGQRVLTVSFTAHDIASIPINSDGKLRLFKCKVEAELDLLAMKFIDADGNRI